MISLSFGFGIGIFIGSLILCLANRSLKKESFWGRSYCENCKHKLAAYDLLPILSYLLLKGKCRYCHKKISLNCLLAEIFVGIAIALLFYTNFPFIDKLLLGELFTLTDPNLYLVIIDILFKIFLVSVLIIVFITDIETGLIPDRITFPAIKIALSYLLIVTILRIYSLYIGLQSSNLGKLLLPPHSDYFYRHALFSTDLLVYGLLSSLFIGLFFGGLIFFTRGRGMGGGDFKLGIFMGLSLGHPYAFLAIVLSFILGSIVGVFLLLTRIKHFGQTIPFGPFLSLGGLIALFWGEQIINWYFNSLSGSIIP